MKSSSPLLPLALIAALACSCTATTAARRDEGTAAMAHPSSIAPIERRTGVATATDGVPIYYESCGHGPAIVLVHGLGGNHAVWFQQVAHFAKDHTVVTVSQRGFAPSGGDQKHYDALLLAGDLTAVMDAAGVRKAVVVGQSMGGWTALALAMRSPERVEALVLADTLGGIHDDEIAADMKKVAAEAARLHGAPPPLGVHPALSPAFSASRPELAYLYQTLTTFGAPAPESIVKQLAATRVPGESLKDFRVPTLLIVGSEDRLFPPVIVRRGAAYITGAKVVVIPGSGHSPYFEDPAAWNAALESFLASR
jgi:3-oxoadipate enol-lactonase